MISWKCSNTWLAGLWHIKEMEQHTSNGFMGMELYTSNGFMGYHGNRTIHI